MAKLAKFFVMLSALFLFSMSCGPTAYAEEGGSLAGILERIEKGVKEFKESVEEYYGIKLDDYKKPVTFKTPDIMAIKEVASLLANMTKLQGTESDYSSILYPEGSSAGVTIANNDQVDTITAQTIRRMLLTFKDCPKDSKSCMENSVANVQAQIAAMKMSNPYDPRFVNDNSYKKALQPNPGNKVLNLDALLGPLAYRMVTGDAGSFFSSSKSSEQSQSSAAAGFIKFASALADPLAVAPFLPKEPEKAARYLAGLRTYAAQMSVGLSNLHQMLARRVRTGAENPRSQLELEHQMAVRRLGGEWHTQMEQASPLTVSRETLYILAEMNYMLYQHKVQQERLLATISMLQLQSMRFMGRGSLGGYRNP